MHCRPAYGIARLSVPLIDDSAALFHLLLHLGLARHLDDSIDSQRSTRSAPNALYVVRTSGVCRFFWCTSKFLSQMVPNSEVFFVFVFFFWFFFFFFFFLFLHVGRPIYKLTLVSNTRWHGGLWSALRRGGTYLFPFEFFESRQAPSKACASAVRLLFVSL